MAQRQVEIFVAGCPRCDEAVSLVQEMSCTACQIQVWDVCTEQITAIARQKLEDYGIHRLPAVVVNGALVDCCRHQQPIARKALVAVGVGQE